jgi:hypothetical protein
MRWHTLCAEDLTSLLPCAEDNGSLKGVKVCRAAPAVPHFLFAHDPFIFMQADISNARTLQQILHEYYSSSGQLVSEAKSSLFSVLVLGWRIVRQNAWNYTFSRRNLRVSNWVANPGGCG